MSTDTVNVEFFVPKRIWLLRFVMIATLAWGAYLYFFAEIKTLIEKRGDATIYTSDFSTGDMFLPFAICTGISAAIIFSLPAMLARFTGLALGLITAVIIYLTVTTDVSNHHIRVSPIGVIHEVGSRSAPIRSEIEFAKTAALYVDEFQQGNRTQYELVALQRDDTPAIRIPIYDMMRAALPEICKAASLQGVELDESVLPFIVSPELLEEDAEASKLTVDYGRVASNVNH